MQSNARPVPSYIPWLQVVIASLAMVMTIPGRTQGLGLITKPILEDQALYLDQTMYAWLNLLATLAGAVFAIPCGWLIDRLGIKLILVFNVLLLGLATWFFSQTETMLSFFAGMLLMRGLGQSALSTTSLTLIGKWFPQRVTVAMAVFGIVSTIGFIALFGLVGKLADTFGWRQTWAYLGFGAIALAIVFQILCRNPASQSPNKQNEDTASEQGSTWREALQSPVFWLFALSSALFNWVSSGIGLFNEDVLAERGFNRNQFEIALGIATMVTLLSNGLGGWLSTRWPLPRLMALGMLMLAACLLSLPYMNEVWHVYLNAVFLGVSAGVVIVVFFACWANYFGTKNLGKIQGSAQALTVLSSALGPVSLALSKEYFGSYRPLFLVLAGLACLSALLCLLAKDAVKVSESLSQD